MNSTIKKPELEDSWLNELKEEFEKEYFLNLKNFLLREKENFQIFPEGKKIFEAFNLTSFENVKVVLIGQDPYHGQGQAHGLSFSVPSGVRTPPSLMNIFKEIDSDLGIQVSKSGNLEGWAKQGVLLLNATLTVRANEPGSHQKKGWENFTNKIIKILSQKRENLVFLLWGKYAQEKEQLIDNNKHLVLKAAHPSPLARGAFFGCKHFSITNSFLKSKGIEPIIWQDH